MWDDRTCVVASAMMRAYCTWSSPNSSVVRRNSISRYLSAASYTPAMISIFGLFLVVMTLTQIEQFLLLAFSNTSDDAL